MKKTLSSFLLSFPGRFAAACLLLFAAAGLSAQSTGTWTPLSNLSPYENAGVMLLLSDGSVIAKTNGGSSDGIGDVWVKLSPDANGSYVNGTWSNISAMSYTRLYFSSQVMRDGRVYVAGGEYGTGSAQGEIYDPIQDLWNPSGLLNPGDTLLDANSKILPDGRILQAIVKSSTQGYKGNLLYDPATYSYTYAPQCHKSHDESSWLKLPDNSILFVDFSDVSSERYIPSLNQWVTDGIVPVHLYDNYIGETGTAYMLPDGRAFFLGSNSNSAYYTPSGNNSPGTWAAGPVVPNNLGQPDAAGAMMVNGKILFAASPVPTSANIDSAYKSPTYFYEFDYTTNAYTQASAPNGFDTLNIPCYMTNMLDLPDGSILYASQGSTQYYTYTPNGSPLAAGKPTIGHISRKTCDSLMITGTLFNGISEGASYGDDWQMATNYPLVRLSSASGVYYARTYNWNSTGIMRGAQADTTYFTMPAGLPAGTYSLVVVANGISSDPVVLSPCYTGISETDLLIEQASVYPSPAIGETTLTFSTNSTGAYTVRLLDVTGRTAYESTGQAQQGNNKRTLPLGGLAQGLYTVQVEKGNHTLYAKLIVR